MPELRVRRLASPLLLAAVAAIGCGEEDDSGVDVPPEFIPIAGCEDYSYMGCDVLEESCRHGVMGLVSCLRGNAPGDFPSTRILTEAEFRLELEQATVSDSDPVDPRYERAMYWLGLVPENGVSDQATIDERVSETRAYYSADTEEITLIRPADPAAAADAETFTLLLAHELAHALQDRDLDLSAQADRHDHYDDVLAFRSMVEGEAMLYQSLIEAAFWALDPERIHLDRRFESFEAQTDEHVIGDPTPLLDSFHYFPYSYGASYVYGVYASEGSSAVRALPAGPPRGTLSLFSPDAPPVEPTPWASPPAAPPGWELVGDETLGAFMVFVFLERAGTADARDLAYAWRADSLYLFGDASTETNVMAAWRLRFDAAVDPAVAAQAFAAVSYGTTARAQAHEGDVLVLLGDPTVLDAWAPLATGAAGAGGTMGGAGASGAGGAGGSG